MRKSMLALTLGITTLLAGCPSLTGTSSKPTLEPKVLAVTSSEQGITTSSVALSWSGVTNAATYQIIRKVGDSTTSKLIATTDKTSYNDNVNPNLTISYTVQAYSPTGDMLVSSSPKTVQVLNATVPKPSGLAIDSKAASGDTIVAANSSKPTFTWTDTTGANAYYLTVNEEDQGVDGKLVFAALTKSPALTLGTLPQADLSLPRFTQLNANGLPKGKIYSINLTAIRADNADLTLATAFDVAAMDTPARLGW